MGDRVVEAVRVARDDAVDQARHDFEQALVEWPVMAQIDTECAEKE